MLPYAPYFSVYCLDRIDSIDTEQEYICLQWGLFPFWDIFQCSKGINNLEKGLSLFPVLHWGCYSLCSLLHNYRNILVLFM